MRRLLVASALIAALCGCDDASDETRMETGAIVHDDAATPLPTIQVSNVGAACGEGLACSGATAECLERSSTATVYPGGYCTATCASDAECGADGVCPIAEAERLEPRYDFIANWPRKCFRRCALEAQSGCRPDYRCRSLAEAYWRPSAPAPMRVPVCIPMPAGGDAGAPSSLDAGDHAKH